MSDDEGNNSADSAMRLVASESCEESLSGNGVDEDFKPDDGSTSHTDQEDAVEQPAFTLATLGLQRVGTVPPPKPKVQQPPVQMLNARGMPARIRKRNRLFYDENIINDDKPLRMSLSPKKPQTKVASVNNNATNSDDNTGSGGGQRMTRKMHVTPSKVLKKRRGVVSRYMRSDDQQQMQQQQQQQQHHKIKKKINVTIRSGVKSLNNSSHGKTHKISAATKLNAVKRSKGTAGDGITLSSSMIITGSTKGRRSRSMSSAYAVEDSKALANKLVGQTIGLCLRNLLKLPKAHKWAIAEWFYSYIDKPLFDGDNEFLNFIRELYPGLNTRNMTRGEWRHVRRMMGKPRRCSQAFFDEERRELERKRMVMRTLQSRKPGELKDLVLLHDMPDKIPMPLPVGTKVTARLRQPQDGIFSGSVDAYDSLQAIYRVTFERAGLGTHSIHDFEIVSENFHEMLPLHSFTKDFRPNLISIFNGNSNSNNNNNNYATPQKPIVGGIMGVRSALNLKLNKSDPLLGQEAIAASSPFKTQLARNHGYPTKLLENFVRLRRTTNMKRSKVQRLSDMNDEAQVQVTRINASTKFSPDKSNSPNQGLFISDEFQRRYASNIISIEKLNSDIMNYLNEVQKFSSGLSRNPHVQAMIAPTFLREQCREMSDKSVDRLNNTAVKSPKMIKLIKSLATLLMISSRIGADSSTAEVGKVLEGCMEEVRTSLISRDNASVFQKNVQLHLHHLALNISKNVALTPKSPISQKGQSPIKEEDGIPISDNESKQICKGNKLNEVIEHDDNDDEEEEHDQLEEHEEEQMHEEEEDDEIGEDDEPIEEHLDTDELNSMEINDGEETEEDA